MKQFLLLFVVAMTLSACVTPTTTIKPLNPEDKGVRNIQEVNVSYSELAMDKLVAADEKLQEEQKEASTPEAIKYKSLKDALSNITKQHLEERDGNGELYADIEIEIDNLKLANAAAAVLVGDTDQLAGTVKVYDPQSKELLSEFYVDVIKGTGGLLGLAIRGTGVREQLSLQFAGFIADEMGFPKNAVVSSETEE